MSSPSATNRVPLVHHDNRTGRAVFVAPGRDDRPNDAALAAAHAAGDAAVWCPFCAGNESRTPPVILQTPSDPATRWQARIIPNRYPFVGLGQAAGSDAATRPAHGVHEVVIESPRHDTSILAVDRDGWRASWELVRRRLEMLSLREDFAWGMVFKNSGPMAGASLEHVHSQVVAVDFLPPAMQAECAAAVGESEPFARLLEEATADGRLVATLGGLVALVPAAPRQPGEIWIMPTDREPNFHAAKASTAAALADLTCDLVGRLGRVLPGGDFNWWLHEAPWRGDELALAAAKRWHWHLEILPRINQLAGFELGTGCHITGLPAAEAAALLRDG